MDNAVYLIDDMVHMVIMVTIELVLWVLFIMSFTAMLLESIIIEAEMYVQFRVLSSKKIISCTMKSSRSQI